MERDACEREDLLRKGRWCGFQRTVPARVCHGPLLPAASERLSGGEDDDLANLRAAFQPSPDFLREVQFFLDCRRPEGPREQNQEFWALALCLLLFHHAPTQFWGTAQHESWSAHPKPKAINVANSHRIPCITQITVPVQNPLLWACQKYSSLLLSLVGFRLRRAS